METLQTDSVNSGKRPGTRLLWLLSADEQGEALTDDERGEVVAFRSAERAAQIREHAVASAVFVRRQAVVNARAVLAAAARDLPAPTARQVGEAERLLRGLENAEGDKLTEILRNAYQALAVLDDLPDVSEPATSLLETATVSLRGVVE